MKQPELGQKLTELRKQKNLTQEELVEECHVSVRTIQRIESGEVTPRMSTVKILLAALGEDFDTFRSEIAPGISHLQNTEQWMHAAWISGIVYFVMGFVDAGFEFTRFEYGDREIPEYFYLISKAVYLISYSVFMMGLIKLADYFNNYLLKISGYLMIGLFTMIIALDMSSLVIPISDTTYLFIGFGESMSVGVAGILLGIGLIRLQDGMGVLAKAAGALEIVAGFFFLLVFMFWAGYIMLIPSTILEIILLFKAAEFIRIEHRK